jgi:hypothetical protein
MTRRPTDRTAATPPAVDRDGKIALTGTALAC